MAPVLLDVQLHPGRGDEAELSPWDMVQSTAKVLRVSFDISHNSCRLFCNVQCSVKMGFSYSLLCFTDKTLPGLLQFCEMEQQKKTIYNFAPIRLSGLPFPWLVLVRMKWAPVHWSVISRLRDWTQPPTQTPQLTQAARGCARNIPGSWASVIIPHCLSGWADRRRIKMGLSKRGKVCCGFYSSGGRCVYTAGDLFLQYEA